MTLLVSIFCAYTPQNNGDGLMSSFYSATFLQSVNTAYDIISFIYENEYMISKRMSVFTMLVVIFQIIVAVISMIYILSFAKVLENNVFVIITAILTSSPIVLLTYELFIHIGTDRKNKIDMEE